jgi:glutathione reductase (NADPH)
MARFDRVVIGTGNAGQAAAAAAREQGLSVAMVDCRPPGGTCALRGCVPKKVLVAAAEALDTIRRAEAHGIRVGSARLDWGALIARVRSFVEGTPDDVARSLEAQGIALLRGEAQFVGPDAIDVDGERVEADGFVVATGSVPATLGIDGEDHLLTSEDLLETPELPGSVVFAGAGVIAFEFAHVMARAGAEVTLVGGRPLAAFDSDVVERLIDATRERGIRVQTGARVQGVTGEGAWLRVSYAVDGDERTVEAEAAVHAAGRVPDLAELALEAAGIELEGGQPRLDAALRSVTNPRIAFAGDAVAAAPQLSPVASWAGRYAAEHLGAGASEAPDYTSVPRVVFAIPALAAVGLDPRRAAQAGLEVDVRDTDMRGWRSARTYAEEHAFARVVLERGSGRVLGATLLGHGAAEVIHTFAWAVRHRWTAADLKSAVYAYPTFHADIKYLLG